jgi:hypothetical protein
VDFTLLTTPQVFYGTLLMIGVGVLMLGMFTVIGSAAVVVLAAVAVWRLLGGRGTLVMHRFCMRH